MSEGRASVKSVLPGLGLSHQAVQARLLTLAHMGRAKWIRLAQMGLRSTAPDYIRGILPVVPVQLVGSRALGAVVTLEGALPNMIEWGAPAWDLRKTILKPGTRNMKVSKRGFRYLIIPMRHGAPRASASDPTKDAARYLAPMGAPYARKLGATQATALGKEVYRLAKKLDPSVSVLASGRARPPVYATQWGGRLADKDGGPRLLGRHKTGLYAGMVKVQKAYAKAKQNKYLTFRVISDDPRTFRSSDGAVNWTHPGFVPRHFLTLARAYVESQATHVFTLAPAAEGAA